MLLLGGVVVQGSTRWIWLVDLTVEIGQYPMSAFLFSICCTAFSLLWYFCGREHPRLSLLYSRPCVHARDKGIGLLL